jgi:hypothetical protein
VADKDDRLEPGESTPGDDELLDRISRARESISRRLRDLADQAQRDETALRLQAADELARVAALELGRSLARFESATDKVVAQRLGEAVESLNAEARDRHREQLAEVRKVAAATIAETPPSPTKPSWRERRHELKLARAESSRRVSEALAKLEQRGGALIGEVDSRAAIATRRIEDAEARLRRAAAELDRAEGQAGGQLAAALLRVDRAAGQVSDAEQRVVAIEARALTSATRAHASAELTRHAAELQARLREAASREAQAAERMEAAERRLRDLIADR